MEWDGEHATLRWVIVIAIAAIVSLAMLAALYGWYAYKTAGLSTNAPSPSPAANSSATNDVLQNLTPKSDKSLLTPQQEARIQAAMSAPVSAQAHPVTQATLDSLTPPR